MTLWRLTGTVNELIARLPFAIAGLLMMLTVYLLGRGLWSERAGLIAAGLLALNGFMVGFSRIVQYQVLVVWMSALALLCIWEWRCGWPRSLGGAGRDLPGRRPAGPLRRYSGDPGVGVSSTVKYQIANRKSANRKLQARTSRPPPPTSPAPTSNLHPNLQSPTSNPSSPDWWRCSPSPGFFTSLTCLIPRRRGPAATWATASAMRCSKTTWAASYTSTSFTTLLTILS